MVSASRWATYRDDEKRYESRFVTVRTIKVGDGGISWMSNMVLFHAGDRVFKVSVQSKKGPSLKAPTKRVKQVAAQVAEIADDVEVYPAKQHLKACAPGEEAAEAIIGGAPTVTRQYVDEYHHPYCGWATEDAAVSTSAQSITNPERYLTWEKKTFGGQVVKCLGRKALYVETTRCRAGVVSTVAPLARPAFPHYHGDDGSSVMFLTGKKIIVRVQVGHGLPGSKAQLIALAKAIAPAY